MAEVAIVGAGVAGLAAAAALGADARPTIVERLPVLGGEHWREPRVASLVAAAERVSPRLMLGQTAIRWTGEKLLVLGVDGAVQLRADALVIATGHRPHTRGELGLGGDRAGGVVPATVALHLLHHRALVGRRPAILGGSVWAAEVAGAARALGAERVTVTSETESFAPELQGKAGGWLQLVPNAVPHAVRGMPRVGLLECDVSGTREGIKCDAVVLASGRVPLRNVDGAIFSGSRVVHAQVGGLPPDHEVSVERGRQAALEVYDILASPGSAEPVEPIPRIGGRRERDFTSR
jgi:pyruvate/2-oxoglutarate dehydrogenase complex dihydrolipoamide dehydrogenase (E3) component